MGRADVAHETKFRAALDRRVAVPFETRPSDNTSPRTVFVNRSTDDLDLASASCGQERAGRSRPTPRTAPPVGSHIGGPETRHQPTPTDNPRTKSQVTSLDRHSQTRRGHLAVRRFEGSSPFASTRKLSEAQRFSRWMAIFRVRSLADVQGLARTCVRRRTRRSVVVASPALRCLGSLRVGSTKMGPAACSITWARPFIRRDAVVALRRAEGEDPVEPHRCAVRCARRPPTSLALPAPSSPVQDLFQTPAGAPGTGRHVRCSMSLGRW